jgi:4-diphosphocytidyl-2-C-methyl-D-erythritol kinase
LSGAGVESAGAALSLTLEAPAKVNLWLHVLGRSDDGYHLLDTVFQSLELADVVSVTCRRVAAGGERVALSVGGQVPCAGGSENLCVRAAEAYLARWPAPVSVEIVLEKRVPVAAGLGGGSSDAAAVLLALRRLLGRPTRRRDLEETARSLGADVPYFLIGGTARGRGRGDLVEPLRDLRPTALWLVAPPVEVATAAVFTEYARGASGGREPRCRPIPLPEEHDLEHWIRGNDLEAAARMLCAEVEAIYTAFHRFGFSSVQLSGSGGVVFGVPPRGLRPQSVAGDLDGVGRLYVTRTRPRRAFGAG